jgi:hypothetical protein
MTQRITKLILGTFFAMSAQHALADESEPYSPTAFADIVGGYSTYKSALLASNDTSTTLSYGVGMYAGLDRSFGMKLDRSSATFSFALNSSKIVQSWQDLHLIYRFGVTRLGVVVTSSSYTITAPPDSDGDGKPDDTADPVDYIDVVTNGYGVSGGFSYPLARRALIESDFIYALAATGRQKAAAADATTTTVTASQRESSIGPRMEAGIGGRFYITRKALTAVVGFKYSSFTVTVDGTAKADIMTSTYAGLATAWYF